MQLNSRVLKKRSNKVSERGLKRCVQMRKVFVRSSVHVPIHAERVALYSAQAPDGRDPRRASRGFITTRAFQRLPKKERKAVADDRFAAMHHDGAFNARSRSWMGQARPRRCSRSARRRRQRRRRRQHYQQSRRALRRRRRARRRLCRAVPLPGGGREEEDYSDDEDELDDEEEIDDEGEEEEEDDDEGEGETSSATESDVSDDEDEAEGDKSALVGWLEQSHGDGVPRVSDGTRRLAVVNLNWDHVRSVDILAVLRSFVPAGGRILSVTVYPSEFGEQRMAEEATVGPGGLLASKRRRGSGSSRRRKRARTRRRLVVIARRMTRR